MKRFGSHLFFCCLLFVGIATLQASEPHEEETPSKEEIFAAAKSSDDAQRVWACEHLGEYRDPQALELIDQLTRDPESIVRSASVMALMRWPASQEKLLPILQALAKDSDSSVRAAVASNLDIETYEKIFKQLLHDKEALVRVAAIESFSPMLNVDPTEEFLRLVEDPEAFVRAAVAKAFVTSPLGRRAVEPKIAKTLLKMVEDKSPLVQRAAIHALGCIEYPSEEIQKKILEYARTNNTTLPASEEPTLQQEALWALGYQLEMGRSDGILYNDLVHDFLLPLCKASDAKTRLLAFEAIRFGVSQADGNALRMQQFLQVAIELAQDPDPDVSKRLLYLLK